MMLRSVTLALATVAMCLGFVSAFTTVKPSVSTMPPSSTALEAKKKDAINVGKMVTGAIAGAFFLSNVMSVDVASAMPVNDFGASSTSMVIAGRSGGRMGGRAPRMSSPRMAAPSRGYSSAPSYSRTTIVRPMISPGVVVSPFGGYGYNPMGGFGMGYGLGALNSAGNSNTDYRQEAEIQKEKAELEQAKEKNVELEQRIKALEQEQPTQAKE